MIQPPIRCIEFVELVTDWMERVVTEDATAMVEEHLAICPDCDEYVRQLRHATRLMRTLDQAPPPAARDALLRAFRAPRPD